MFVKMARRLAGRGVPCLRFDFRGRGESGGQVRAASIAGMTGDAVAAVAFLRETADVDRVILLGICSGGKVAIGAAAVEAGVSGLALWSCEPMGDLRTVAVETRKRMFVLREYVRKMFRPETWKKILMGRVNVGQVRRAVVRKDETPDGAEIAAERQALARFLKVPRPVLFIHGTNDPDTALAAGRYAELCRRSGMETDSYAIEGANHSFYSLAWEAEVMDLTERWIKTYGAKSRP
jgi:pimeloyl-ACP methyl ester carboxylesterase